MSFTVNPMPEQVDPALLERLSKCDTATIGHFEHETFMDVALKPVIPGVRVAGTAVTIRMPHIDSVLPGYVLCAARPGDFIVIDRCHERKHATWGGVVAYAAAQAGIAGAIVDGPTTDFGEQQEYGVPCWCRGASPITCKKLGIGGSVNIPVSVGGVTVHPGDAIVADDSGIFVCPPERVAEVADEALSRQEREKTTLKRLKDGEKLGDVSGVRQMVHDSIAKQGGSAPW